MRQLPETGFLRLPQIIGAPEVTEQQAEENRKRGKGSKSKRPAVPPIIPISRSSFWAGVKSGKFPKPIKLGPRTTVWRIADIRAFLDNQ